MNFCTYESAVNPINQTEKFSSVSDKYQLIRTDKIIEVFQDNGLNIVGESIAKTRKEEREGFQKHLVALSNDALNVGEERLQLLLTNAHDGSSSYQLDLGCFRFACANGLVKGDVESTIRIRHIGDCLNRLNDAIQYQLERLPKIAGEINKFKGVQLTPELIREFQKQATEIRLHDKFNQVEAIRPMNPKRSKDLGIDLWTVFNRVQEYCLRGGISYLDKESGKWKKTRKITGVNSVTKINKELWNLADSYYEIAA